jgi:hypothetical protein
MQGSHLTDNGSARRVPVVTLDPFVLHGRAAAFITLNDPFAVGQRVAETPRGVVPQWKRSYDRANARIHAVVRVKRPLRKPRPRGREKQSVLLALVPPVVRLRTKA